MSSRDGRFRRTVGVRGRNYGVRFVEDGAVKVAWYVGGKRHVRIVSHKNTADAREQADEILKAALNATVAPSDPMTLSTLLVHHRENAKVRRHPRTGTALRAKTLADYAEYERHILRGLDPKLPAGALRKAMALNWIDAQRAQGLAEGTIARRVDYLKQVYRWAVERDLLEASPLVCFKSPSRMGRKLPYTEDEAAKLMDAVLALPSRAWRFRLLALLEAAYGPRVMQPLGLIWSDFDLDRVTRVPLPTGEVAMLVGTVRFRQDVVGSKGQEDRVLPLLPFVREAVLAAFNHRRSDSDLVFWSWRDPLKASPYGSMNHRLRKLEQQAGVVRKRGRAFHAFRRSLTNELVRRLGVLQASGWIADTPAVLMRHYASATEQAVAEAAAYLICRWAETPKQSLNRQSDSVEIPKSLSDNTGAGGVEPPTSRLTAGRSAD